MLELTNEQRACFGIRPIDPAWRRVKLIRSPYHSFDVFVFMEGNRIRHMVQIGESDYQEYAVDETVSPDGMFLLPKTEKGKTVKLSAATFLKRTPTGMVLYFSISNGYSQIFLYCKESDLSYYQYSGSDVPDFNAWVDAWCADTTAADLADIAAFAQQPRRHVKYREGDYFRFRIGRREYGYGRLLIDYGAMRRRKLPFWDIFFGKPLLVGYYRIITEDPNIPISVLDGLGMLPPGMMMDNKLYYGEYQVIGNAPVDLTQVDCPIHYGRGLGAKDYTHVLYQCGRTFRELDGVKPLGQGFINNGSGFRLSIPEHVMRACMESDSNDPYWAHLEPFEEVDRFFPNRDMRHPKYAELLKQVRAQMGVE